MGGGGVIGGFIGWVVGGFMGCVCVWWCESSWVGEYMHPPHPGGVGCDEWKGMGVTGRWA